MPVSLPPSTPDPLIHATPTSKDIRLELLELYGTWSEEEKLQIPVDSPELLRRRAQQHQQLAGHVSQPLLTLTSPASQRAFGEHLFMPSKPFLFRLMCAL
jgi:hypothetical protein